MVILYSLEHTVREVSILNFYMLSSSNNNLKLRCEKMNKKILLMSVVLLAFAMSLSFVTAAADINAPDGFKVNEKLSVTNQTGEFQGKEAIITIVVMENGTDNITATTFAVNGDVNMTPLPDSQNKTINGKDGIFLEKNGRALFVYKVGEQIVNIDAPNEQLIEKVVV